MTMMIQNLPSSSFPRCPIYTALTSHASLHSFISHTHKPRGPLFPIFQHNPHTVSFHSLSPNKKKTQQTLAFPPFHLPPRLRSRSLFFSPSIRPSISSPLLKLISPSF